MVSVMEHGLLGCLKDEYQRRRGPNATRCWHYFHTQDMARNGGLISPHQAHGGPPIWRWLTAPRRLTKSRCSSPPRRFPPLLAKLLVRGIHFLLLFYHILPADRSPYRVHRTSAYKANPLGFYRTGPPSICRWWLVLAVVRVSAHTVDDGGARFAVYTPSARRARSRAHRNGSVWLQALPPDCTDAERFWSLVVARRLGMADRAAEAPVDEVRPEKAPRDEYVYCLVRVLGF